MSAMVTQITGVWIFYSNVCCGADQRKHQRSASLSFVWGIRQWQMNSPHKESFTRKMFPFDDVIMSAWAGLFGADKNWHVTKFCIHKQNTHDLHIRIFCIEIYIPLYIIPLLLCQQCSTECNPAIHHAFQMGWQQITPEWAGYLK